MFNAERTTYQGRKRPIFFLGFLVALVWTLALWGISGNGRCVAGEGRGGIDFGNNHEGRYSIFDRNFELAATNFSLTAIYFMPLELEDIRATAARLAPLLALDEKELRRRLRSESSFFRLPGYLTTEAADRIRAMGLKGVYLVGEERRFYPHRNLASHLIGFTRKGRGLSGVEALFDQDLRRGKDPDDTGAEARGNVVLTVDFGLQRRLEESLTRLLQGSGAETAMAGVIEVGSGDILALACVPDFDPNRLWDYESSRMINSFTDSRRTWPGLARFFPAAAENGAADFFVRMGRIPARDESFGAMPAALNVDHVSGQQEVTPLEVLVALARMINGGRPMTPHLKKIMWREDRGFFKPFTRHGPTTVVTAEESHAFLAAMNSEAENDMVFLDSTRSIISGDESGAYEAALAAYYPARNPRLAFLLAVDNLPADDAGEQRGLRDIARNILVHAAAIKSAIQPPDPRRLAAVREEIFRSWQVSLAGAGDPAPEKNRDETAVMPELVGMSLRRALRHVQLLGVMVRVTGSGRVTAQSPAGGSPVRRDDLVTLELAAQS